VTDINAKGHVMKPNLAARAGRWSAAHWKTATFGWLLLVVGAVVLGSAAGTKTLGPAEQANGETARAEQILAGAGRKPAAGESVLVQSAAVSTQSPAFGRALHAVHEALAARPEVTKLQAPVTSKDRHSALVQFELKGDPVTASDRVQPVLDAVASVQRAQPAFRIAEFGAASADRALSATVGKDFARAERLSLPLTFLILLFAFGAFVAAGVPVLLAFSAVLGSIGLSALVSHVAHASETTSSVILLMGMAVGVDYSLFYVKREREEKAAGHAGRDALHRAAATSGQAVLVSGITVLIAMAGMLLAGSKIFTSLGIGAMLVVFMSMVGSLTVLPALLGKLGDKIDRGVLAVLAAGTMRVLRRRPRFLVRLTERKTLLQRFKGDRQESRVWAAVLRPSLRHPVIAASGSAALLVVLALPAFGMHLKMTGFGDLPSHLPIVQTYKSVQRAFPGAPSPATVVVRGTDLSTPEAKAALADLRRRALASGVMKEPIRTVVNAQHTVAQVDVPLAGTGDDAKSIAALKTLRTDVVPAALGGLPGAVYAVTGETAGSADFTSSMRSRAPIVFAFVLGLAFLLLLLMFRSIVVPIKAIVLNLLSVGAAYGVLVWIFQDGHLQGPLGFHSNGGIVTWLPLFLFTVLFGLSMDYHVFIISRIRELVDGGLSTAEAVDRGIRTTASTVTSAALVMVAVFAIFATLSTLDIKQMGVGLAVAVILDATIIRGVLLPATMKLLGDWNWYLPRGLRWLPRFNLERSPQLPMPQVD
jgi:RND superfamily putative drug exporter